MKYIGHTRYWSWDPQHVELMWCHYTMWPFSVIYCSSSYFHSFLETHQFLLLFLFFDTPPRPLFIYLCFDASLFLSFFLFFNFKNLTFVFQIMALFVFLFNLTIVFHYWHISKIHNYPLLCVCVYFILK